MVAKFIHIVLSLSILLSTTGLTLAKHYCQGEMQAVGVLSKASCCEKNEKAPCFNSDKSCGSHQDGDEDDGCCNSQPKYYKLSQDEQVQNVDFHQLKNPALLSAIFVVFNVHLPIEKAAKANYQTYRPPIVCDDILIRLQTFLC